VAVDQGADVKETLKKRARSKYITKGLVTKLADKSESLKKSYWHTWHCSEKMEQKDGKIVGSYCKNRWCLTCNRIRTAKLILGYMPQIRKFKDLHFVTLTIPNVKGEVLKDTIELMNKKFNLVRQGVKRTDLHTPSAFKALRKLECTYNLQRGDYHPHYHLLVEGKHLAECILSRWLDQFPSANNLAQDIRSADEKSALELFKYFTKVFVKNKSTNEMEANSYCLNTIFEAVRRKRTFQPYGIKMIAEEIEDLEAAIDVNDEYVTVWQWVENDWVDVKTGEFLSGYSPGPQAENLIKSIK